MSAAPSGAAPPPAPWPRHAVVTGASRGLGLEIVDLLATAGTRTLGTARNAAALERALAGTGGGESSAEAVAGDLTDAGHRRRLRREVRDRFGGALDLLVLNASTLGPSPLPALLDLDPEDFTAALRTNLTEQLALVAALAPALRAGQGRIVAVSSDAAHGAYPGWGAYGASKIGLELIIRTLAAEEPELHPLIVDPGDLRTEMHQAAFPGESIDDRPLPAVTRPFWTWAFAQPPEAARGRRIRAQGDAWTLPDRAAPDAAGAS